jgi:hypothetical protein
MKNFKFLILVLLNMTLFSCKSQNIINQKFDFYKIDLKSEETELTKIMRNNYKKEFYVNENVTLYKNKNNDFLELIFFYNNKIEKHLFKNNEVNSFFEVL